MNTDLECPSSDQLTDLLNEALSAEEQSSMENHLARCTQCRTRIEQLATGGTSPNAANVAVEALGSRDAGLEKLKEKLKRQQMTTPTVGDYSSGEGITLEFLAPSESANSLGRLGIYDIMGVIGSGGMGIVLKGHDPRLNRVVAIKVLSPQLASNANARNRFLREAQKAAAVAHEHVVAIHAVDEQDGLPYIVMEYIVGVSLAERIKRTGSLKAEEILRIGMQTAQGLAAAHAQGLVHRDVKPSNILLENGVERVKLADFGLARAVDDTEITGAGAIVGTPQYMSPEQARGEKVDHRGDLFSLGCVMYSMCTGRSPFRATTVVEAIRRVCDDTPRPIRDLRADLPARLIDTIEGLLKKDPEKRVQSAAELANRLNEQLALIQRGDGVSPLTASDSRRSSASHRARGIWYLIATCIAVLLIALGAYLGSSGTSPTPSNSGDDPPPPSEDVASHLTTLSGITLSEARTLLDALPDHPNVVSELKQYERRFWWDKVHEFAIHGRANLVQPAYLVAQAWPGAVSIDHLKDLAMQCRRKGRHTAADLIHAACCDEARSQKDVRTVMWNTVGRARLRADLRDFEGADHFMSEAIQILEQDRQSYPQNPRAGDELWIHHERATFLQHRDHTEEAAKEYRYVAQKMEQYTTARVHIWWLSRGLEDSNAYLDSCLRLGDLDPGVVIERLSDKADWWAFPVTGKAHLLKGDIESAIEVYATAALSEPNQTEPILDVFEEELVSLVLAQPSHQTRLREVLEDLVKLQDDILAPMHPRRAFTRRRLAQILVHQSEELDKAEVLLEQALDVLASQSLAPPAVTKEITDLLETIGEMQAE